MKIIEDLRDLPEKELLKEIASSEKELYKLSIQVQAQEEKKVHLIKKYKKYIARIKTIITEKQLSLTTANN